MPSKLHFLIRDHIVTEKLFWGRAPRGGDPSGTLCVLVCLQQALSWTGLDYAQVQSLMVMVDWSLCQMVQSDLAVVKRLSPSDARLIELGCQTLAHNAAAQVS